jgi:uncharacterized membrane protein
MSAAARYQRLRDMTKTRLEAFSDAVVAILMTIMVLELKTPHGTDREALAPLVPTFLAYVLSYIYLGIYWSNHHHLLHATTRVNGAVLWANLHLLFWLSLVPFTTAWVGEHPRVSLPAAAYGGVLLMASIAYLILVRAIIRCEGPGSRVAEAVGRDIKGMTSTALYIAAVPLAFVDPIIAEGIYVAVALMWLVPDPRIEARFHQ